MSIRVLLVDDHKIMREGLRSCLETETDIEVIAEAGDGRTATKLVRQHQPQVVVMDVAMPDMNGVEATRQILRENDRTKVLALSMHSDRRFIRRMLQAGASGYVFKDCALDELATAIRSVVEGRTYLTGEAAEIVVEEYREQLNAAPAGSSPKGKLTDREREVLQMLAEGQTTKQIALRLHVSAKTIETHRQNIMEKLNANGLAGLTKYAIREGFTSLDD